MMTDAAVSLSPLVFGLLIAHVVNLRTLARHGREKPANPDDSMPPALAAASPAMIAAAAEAVPQVVRMSRDFVAMTESTMML